MVPDSGDFAGIVRLPVLSGMAGLAYNSALTVSRSLYPKFFNSEKIEYLQHRFRPSGVRLPFKSRSDANCLGFLS
jgi:hypothetical protein